MIWLNPAGWFALAALAVPFVVHILARRRAERLSFPTLRFIQPNRLAAVRRHVLEDVWLLALRAAILAAAAAAIAGPLLLTGARRAAWNNRTARAIVVDAAVRQSGNRVPERVAQETAFRRATFDAPDLAEGIHRARSWLETAPPARREIVVVSPFPVGALTLADIAAIPGSIGIRFERAGTLPSQRTLRGGSVLGLDRVFRQTIDLEGAATSVREVVDSREVSFPVEVIHSTAAALAAMTAVRSQRVWTVPSNRRARLVLAGQPFDEAAIAGATPPALSWIADAIARIVRDDELQTAAATAGPSLADARFATRPWTRVAAAADGGALAAASSSSAGLLIVSAAADTQLFTPLLLRSIVQGMEGPRDLQSAEVLAIPDSELESWSRKPPAADVPRPQTVERDDRRWLWGLALLLLMAEMWIRRARIADVEEPARVA